MRIHNKLTRVYEFKAQANTNVCFEKMFIEKPNVIYLINVLTTHVVKQYLDYNYFYNVPHLII